MVIDSIKNEYSRYKSQVELAIDQIQDADLHSVVREGGNTIAILMNHLSGNLKSRFTNFLNEDGEKPWRDRDQEFEELQEDRSTLLKNWKESWNILFDQLDKLSDSDLGKIIKIRNHELTVSDALIRSLSHLSYHAGQIVLVAKIHVGKGWKTLSVPIGQSKEYNLNPTKEKNPINAVLMTFVCTKSLIAKKSLFYESRFVKEM
jgi:hypothetical protein